MKSRRHLAVALAGAVALGLAAALSPAASASMLASQAGHSLLANTLVRENSETTAGYTATSLKPPFDSVSAATIAPRFPRCSECQALTGVFFKPAKFDVTAITTVGTGIDVDNAIGERVFWQVGSKIFLGKAIHAGDPVSFSVTVSGSQYVMTVIDSGGSPFTQTMTKSCPAGGCNFQLAEWGAVKGVSGKIPDFGTLTLTNTVAETESTTLGISHYSNTEYTMIDSTGQVMAKPGSLSVPDGTSFSITWKSST